MSWCYLASFNFSLKKQRVDFWLVTIYTYTQYIINYLKHYQELGKA